MSETHRIEIAGVNYDLPIVEIAPKVRVAVLNILGDWKLTELAGKALAKKVPIDIEALIMPEGKAIALLHVIGRETGLPTHVSRKENKGYMGEVISVEYESITTRRVQKLFLGADIAAKLQGKRVAVVDDVISTGGTLIAMRTLLGKIGAVHAGTIAIATEGDERPGVIKLVHLPIFKG